MSKGENKIIDLLNKARIFYVREKTFSDLRQGKFRFDFYLPNVHGRDCIIEFNGEQHYEYVGKFYKNQTEWRQAQGRDMRKISYCLSQDIALYIIPYWEIENITCANDLFQSKFLARDRYKNYLDYEKYKAAIAKNKACCNNFSSPHH